MISSKEYCSACDEYVEPDYVSHSCIAPYGSVVYAKGFCPQCGKKIVNDRMVDDDGLRAPRGNR